MEEFEISSAAYSTDSNLAPQTPQVTPPTSSSSQLAMTHSLPQQQPMHSNSTNSSNSSVASHGLSTPGLEGPPGPFPVITGNSGSAPAPVQNISPSSQGNTVGQATTGTTTAAQTGGTHRPADADSGYCIDWCPNRTATALMVVGLGKEIGARVSRLPFLTEIMNDNVHFIDCRLPAQIFRHDGHNRWYPGEFLPGHEQEVHDVSWAPSMGR